MNQHDEYWKFKELEQHFNNIQAGIRNRASTWILAAFGAIAVLIKTGDGTGWLIPADVLVGLVCFMATIGLLILWINDQLVYHRLLNSAFVIGLKNEFDNNKLPPIRAMMMFSAEGTGMSRWLAYYYTIPMYTFLAISISITVMRYNIVDMDKYNGSLLSFFALVSISIAQGLITTWVQLNKSKVTSKDHAMLFGKNEFTSMFEGTEEGIKMLGKVVERYQPDGGDQKQTA